MFARRFARMGVGIGIALAATAAVSLAAPAETPSGEWPQWRGPERTSVSRETGLLKSWPPEGPKLLWKTTGLGGGYSTPSLAAGRIYGMGYVGADEKVWAISQDGGKPVWSYRIAGANSMIGYNEGSRSTPTIDGDRLYALGVSGDLVCLEHATGKLIWKKNLVTDFGGSIPNWGYSESPLVDGEKVVITPGGKDATLVALNKTNGEVIWKSPVPEGDEAPYASAIAADVDGKREYIQYLPGGVVGVSATDGKFLWRYKQPANGIVIATPIFKDNQVYASAAYNIGGGAAKLTTTPAGVTAEPVYFSTELKNKHGGVVLVGDHLYGFDDPRTLTCLEFKTGKTVWRNPSVGGNGSVVFADGNLYVRSQRGTVALVEATPVGYNEKGRFEQPDRAGKEAWAHPVVVGGKMYLRDQDILLCYDVKAP
jgi:outer membrane protein assembly factor BamB